MMINTNNPDTPNWGKRGGPLPKGGEMPGWISKGSRAPEGAEYSGLLECHTNFIEEGIYWSYSTNTRNLRSIYVD